MNTKWVQLIVACALLLCGSAFAGDANEPVIPAGQGLTIWGLTEGDSDSTLEARIGWELENSFEPGIGVKYFTGDPEWGPEPDAVSAYLAYHVREIGLITDDTPDNAWEEILHSLKTRPYALLEVAVPVDGEQRKPKLNYAIGTLFGNDPSFDTAFVVEWIVGDLAGEYDHAIRIGGRFRF